MFNSLFRFAKRARPLDDADFERLHVGGYPDTEATGHLVGRLNEAPELKRRLAASLREDLVGTVERIFELDNEMRATARKIAADPDHGVWLMALMLDASSIYGGKMSVKDYTDLGSSEGRRRCRATICDDSHAAVPGETEIGVCFSAQF